MQGVCRVGLLGGFRVEVDGRPVPETAWRHRRGADLVKILALAPGHRLPRERAMDMLWPDFGVEAASANLRKATYFARQALGGEGAIGVRGGMISLWPEGSLVVDLEEFERAPALELYGGELLPEDRYTEWSEPRRERARQRCLDLLREQRRWEQVLEVDRADEAAHRALMRGHLEAGNRTAALRQFEKLREVLRVDLGVGPSAETVALFEQALQAESEPPSAEQEARALIARGLVQMNLQQLDEAERLARLARSLALATGLSRELGEASTLLGMAAMGRGRWREVFRADFLEVLERAPDRAEFVLHGHLCLAEVSVYASDPQDTMPVVRELLTVAERKRNLPGQALAHLLLGAPARLGGRLSEAEEEYGHALALYEEFGYGPGQALALIRLAGVAVAGGRPEAARAFLERAGPLVERSELAPHHRVQVFEWRVAAAPTVGARLSVVEEAERTLERSRVCGPCSIGLCVASAIACADSGEIAKAHKCLSEAERLAGMWRGGPWTAATWEARAHLRMAEGDPGQAAALLREAANLFVESGRPLDASRCMAGVAAAV